MSVVKVKPKGKTMLKETTGFQTDEPSERGAGARKASDKAKGKMNAEGRAVVAMENAILPYCALKTFARNFAGIVRATNAPLDVGAAIQALALEIGRAMDDAAQKCKRPAFLDEIEKAKGSLAAVSDLAEIPADVSHDDLSRLFVQHFNDAIGHIRSAHDVIGVKLCNFEPINVEPKGEEESYMREASDLLGIPVAEVRERVEAGRKAKGEQERAARSESARFTAREIRDGLTDLSDLANCAKRGEVGALDPTTVLHAIEEIADACADQFADLCKSMEIEPKHD